MELDYTFTKAGNLEIENAKKKKMEKKKKNKIKTQKKKTKWGRYGDDRRRYNTVKTIRKIKRTIRKNNRDKS